MTHIQLDGPADRPRRWRETVVTVVFLALIASGAFLAGAAVSAPPVRMEMAPGALRRDWTITVKGTVPDRSGVVLVCEAKGRP